MRALSSRFTDVVDPRPNLEGFPSLSQSFFTAALYFIMLLILSNVFYSVLCVACLAIWEWLRRQWQCLHAERSPTPPRKRGLLIGINHSRRDSSVSPLPSGPYQDSHKDVERWKNLLVGTLIWTTVLAMD
jgi:hypothetical protein